SGGSTNVVSDKLVQCAKLCMSSPVSPAASSTTATGLPRNGSELKTSTCLNGRCIRPSLPCGPSRRRRRHRSLLPAPSRQRNQRRIGVGQDDLRAVLRWVADDHRADREPLQLGGFDQEFP